MVLCYVVAVVFGWAERCVERVFLSARQAVSLPDSKLYFQSLLTAALSAKLLVQFPRRQETQEGVERPEKHDAFLVYIGKQFIEFRRCVAVRTTQLNGPALQHNLAVPTTILSTRRTRVCGRWNSICDIPTLAGIVRDYKSLIVPKLSRVYEDLNHQRWRSILV